MRLETDSQEDDVRLDGLRECLGNDPGSDRGRGRRKTFRIASGGNGYVDAVASKRLGQGLADIAKADDCMTHEIFSCSGADRVRSAPWPSLLVPRHARSRSTRFTTGACRPVDASGRRDGRR